MMKILLVCAGGMSTGMLVQKMKEYSESQELNLLIDAVGLSELEDNVTDVNVILLGPQIGFQKDAIKNKYPNIPISVIDMMDYGMMNGEAVLKKALTMTIK